MNDTRPIKPHLSASATVPGRLLLVGAGPGDPDLLTLKAVKALQAADVILHDDLVADAVLEFANVKAQRISVGKRGGRPSWKQAEITGMAIALALEGKTVLRLKGGDPMVFGRADEEISAALDAGVPVEIISGVTAASAAAASLKLSLTKRAVARRVQFVTAHAANGELPTDLDLASLADPHATTCVYMGVKTLPALVQLLLQGGLAPTTPVVVVEYASLPHERIIRGDLSTIVDTVQRVKIEGPIEGPCVLMIGEAMRERAEAADITCLRTLQL